MVVGMERVHTVLVQNAQATGRADDEVVAAGWADGFPLIITL